MTWMILEHKNPRTIETALNRLEELCNQKSDERYQGRLENVAVGAHDTNFIAYVTYADWSRGRIEQIMHKEFPDVFGDAPAEEVPGVVHGWRDVPANLNQSPDWRIFVENPPGGLIHLGLGDHWIWVPRASLRGAIS